MTSKPKLSYCLNCKRDTETVFYDYRVFLLIKDQKRICKACGKPKIKTEVEY